MLTIINKRVDYGMFNQDIGCDGFIRVLDVWKDWEGEPNISILSDLDSNKQEQPRVMFHMFPANDYIGDMDKDSVYIGRFGDFFCFYEFY